MRRTFLKNQPLILYIIYYIRATRRQAYLYILYILQLVTALEQLWRCEHDPRWETITERDIDIVIIMYQKTDISSAYQDF